MAKKSKPTPKTAKSILETSIYRGQFGKICPDCDAPMDQQHVVGCFWGEHPREKMVDFEFNQRVKDAGYVR